MADHVRRDDIGKYRAVETEDQFITSKPRTFGCALGCLGLVFLPLLSYLILFFSALTGRSSQQTGYFAASLLVFSLAILLYGMFFGFGRNRIIEMSRKRDEVKHKGKVLGKLSSLTSIVIESRKIEVKVGSRNIERDQAVIFLEPIGERLPVAFFTKLELAERLARLMSQFTGVPIRNQEGPAQTYFGAGADGS